ncbi:MAG: hypothetical protein ACI4XL_13335 [Bacillus sp. (in: firmicutes)]
MYSEISAKQVSAMIEEIASQLDLLETQISGAVSKEVELLSMSQKEMNGVLEQNCAILEAAVQEYGKVTIKSSPIPRKFKKAPQLQF